MNSVLLSLFEYKAWANTELHLALSQFDAQLYPRQFSAMLLILDHANVVDRIFQGHLMGATSAKPIPRFKVTNSEVLPTLAELRALVISTDDWYLQLVASISAERLNQRVYFTFVDGDHACMSCQEILLHLITHAGYHRGSIGQILEDLGLDSPPDSLTKFLHRTQPERRLHPVAEANAI
ncbi:DinB family protein [Undibacterium sp.]|uniref:DinB family protein n=1 Tax=Undibacterium sp. TaxID=1914977 RepID=UPI0025CCE451|nr:DinB family protein [Undibacterium sp.]